MSLGLLLGGVLKMSLSFSLSLSLYLSLSIFWSYHVFSSPWTNVSKVTSLLGNSLSFNGLLYVPKSKVAQSVSQWVSDKVTYWAVRWQLKRWGVEIIFSRRADQRRDNWLSLQKKDENYLFQTRRSKARGDGETKFAAIRRSEVAETPFTPLVSP